MRQKYKRTPYVHQEWPKMFFHPVNASYVVCADESEVPEGFVDNINKCERKLGPTEEPVRCADITASIADQKAAKKAGKKPAKKAAKKAEPEPEPEKAEEPEENTGPTTLEDLDITRKEAMAMLDEENVQYKKNASNGAIAAAVAELLEDE